MAKARIFDLPETGKTSEFQTRGIVTGVQKKGFFESKTTRNGGTMNRLNFGVEFDEGQTLYITLNAMARDKAYYYNSKTKKSTAVAWKDRSKAPSEDDRLIGVNCGVEKVTDEQGNTSNLKKNLVEYDAAEYVSKHLKDGQSVFVKGNISFEQYKNERGEIHRSTKLVPTQISLCGKDIDFEAEDFEPLADFKSKIIFTGIEKEKDDKDKPTGRFVVDALSVGYSDIIGTSFIVMEEKLAGQMKKGLKEYNSIDVTGAITVNVQTEDVPVEDDDWGSGSTTYTRVVAPRVQEFVIKKAFPATIDKETYTEDNIAEARKAIANKDKAESSFGEKPKKDNDAAPWGEAETKSESEDSDSDLW